MKNIIPIILLALIYGCHQRINDESKPITAEDLIRVNQMGYYVNGPKKFVIAGTKAGNFTLIDQENEIRFNGELSDPVFWETSGEHVQQGDFSAFTNPGTYRLSVHGLGISHPFIIASSIYKEAALASLKSNYFQRVSMPIGKTYGGIYARPAGHPDTACLYHSSTGYDTGGKASPGGWYDAGDYGKYIVNAGISVGTMLVLHELYPGTYGDEDLNIPESGNARADLLDEIRYEVDWMLTMQDEDGGVFHKLTTLNFTGFVMPHETHEKRYFIGKSTAAALNFTAVMAMISRLYEEMDPSFAQDCLNRAEKAWSWALEHPEAFFSNPEDVSTGAYGDVDLKEEFFWAAAELYTTTKEDPYYERIRDNLDGLTFRIEESWRNYQDNIGYYTLLNPEISPLPEEEKAIIKTRLVQMADSLAVVVENHPYRIPIDHFVWGSNSDVLNLAIIFAMAHQYAGDRNYLNLAIETVDYIFGKNATSYSFLTGIGDKTPMNIHHRPSGADGIEAPVPGFVVGGPNGRLQDASTLAQEDITYPYKEPARAYVDVTGSYASNEVCLNWNAPLVFMLQYLEENMK